MSTVGAKKNEPCPCGSGKKFRQCCWLTRLDRKTVGGVACTCKPVMLYWLYDHVWQPAQLAAQRKGDGFGHLCPTCAAAAIGRPLTLEDLSVASYMRTAQNFRDGSGVQFMRDYVRATLIGAMRAVGIEPPPGWELQDHPAQKGAAQIGDQLARQTPDPHAIIPVLVREADSAFASSRTG